MKKEKHIYKYDGPVLDEVGNVLLEKVTNQHDNGTQAVSEEEARHHIAYRLKSKYGCAVLPGKIFMLD